VYAYDIMVCLLLYNFLHLNYEDMNCTIRQGTSYSEIPVMDHLSHTRSCFMCF